MLFSTSPKKNWIKVFEIFQHPQKKLDQSTRSIFLNFENRVTAAVSRRVFEGERVYFGFLLHSAFAVLLFSKFHQFFLGTFDPENLFF